MRSYIGPAECPITGFVKVLPDLDFWWPFELTEVRADHEEAKSSMGMNFTIYTVDIVSGWS